MYAPKGFILLFISLFSSHSREHIIFGLNGQLKAGGDIQDHSVPLIQVLFLETLDRRTFISSPILLIKTQGGELLLMSATVTPEWQWQEKKSCGLSPGSVKRVRERERQRGRTVGSISLAQDIYFSIFVWESEGKMAADGREMDYSSERG